MRKLLIAIVAASAMASPVLAQTATATTTEAFVTAKPTDVLSSNVVELDVMNSANEEVGEIKDLVISDGQLTGYILSVGGFLGLDDRYVVVSPSAVKIVYSENDKKWSATMDATKEQLTAAPEFKYEGRWKE